MTTLKYEFYRTFLIAFGAMQIITNSHYLIRKNGIEAARKQHRELPATSTNRQFRVKIICMLSFGILFFTTGIILAIIRSPYPIAITIALSAYTLYALIEALYYRSLKTWGAFILPVVLLVIIIV